MTPENKQQWKMINALAKRIELLEALVGIPVPEGVTQLPSNSGRPMLPDNWPQFMEPNTRITN